MIATVFDMSTAAKELNRFIEATPEGSEKSGELGLASSRFMSIQSIAANDMPFPSLSLAFSSGMMFQRAKWNHDAKVVTISQSLSQLKLPYFHVFHVFSSCFGMCLSQIQINMGKTFHD